MKTVVKNKKGFTVVELVIVIAVIAILAAVLIPTFISLINRANQSVDEQLVDNLNKILTVSEVTDGKNLFMHDAILDLAANGYELDSLKMSDSENILVWDQEYDRFIIVKNGDSVEFVYCSASDKDNYWQEEIDMCYLSTNRAVYWKIYTSADYVEDQHDGQTTQALRGEGAKLSIYWGGEGAPKFNSNGTFDVGLDLGYYEGKINAKGTTTGNPTWFVFNGKDTRIRGNINSLLIQASGTYHIGQVDTLILKPSLKPSGDLGVHEYGSVGEVKLVEVDGQKEESLGANNKNQCCKLIAESGSRFAQTEDEVKTAVGGANYFENKGGEFGVSFE